MKAAIQRNRQRWKYRNILRRIRLRWFEYEDAGKLDKVQRVIDKCLQRIQ